MSEREEEPCPNCGTYSWPYGRICPGCREVRWELMVVYRHPTWTGLFSVSTGNLVWGHPESFEYLTEEDMPEPRAFSPWELDRFDYSEESAVVLGTRLNEGGYRWWYDEKPVEIMRFEFKNSYTKIIINAFEMPWARLLDSNREDLESREAMDKAVLERLRGMFRGKPVLSLFIQSLWDAMKTGAKLSEADVFKAVYGGDKRNKDTIISNAKQINSTIKGVLGDDPINKEVQKLRVGWNRNGDALRISMYKGSF